MNFRLQNIQKDGKVRYEMKFMALISYAGITRIRYEGIISARNFKAPL